ncbi:Arginyl-tRNA synthetase [[Mycoplasma] cavipharyngis]|uniref:arginine--tRNA ligase n=1 Tax=[Mycoplasma] cavipharyngis TaxID=92757 RepID=UPI003704BA5C
MIQTIKQMINEAINKNHYQLNQVIKLEKNKKIAFGDFSTNVAMIIAQSTKEDVEQIAATLIKDLSKHQIFSKITFAQPGFINFTLNLDHLVHFAKTVQIQKDHFGFQPKKALAYLVELISANPTGLLHVGHARNGIYSDVLVRLLRVNGHVVLTEYLINDSGNQIKNLIKSVYYRYLQLLNQKVSLDENSYHGAEIIECAQAFYQQYQNQYLNQQPELLEDFAINFFMDQIKRDLAQCNIAIETYFSEKKMDQNHEIKAVFQQFQNDIYQKDQATWFASSKYLGISKDEVLIKSDQTITYYAKDLAYHLNKLNRIKKISPKYQLINVWGADHHGHVLRIRAFLKAINEDQNVIFLITQLVRLIKDNQEVKMSKRSGKSLLLKDIFSLLGQAELRWFLVSQSINSHIDINLNIVGQKSSNNPVYYVLYAYARIWQIIHKVPNYQFEPEKFNLLTTTIEREMINQLYCYETTIIQAGQTFEPYHICNYLYDLAKLLHSFYNQNPILNLNDLQLKKQRLDLIYLVQQIIHNGLNILGIQHYDRMDFLEKQFDQENKKLV